MRLLTSVELALLPGDGVGRASPLLASRER